MTHFQAIKTWFFLNKTCFHRPEQVSGIPSDGDYRRWIPQGRGEEFRYSP